MNRPDFDPYLPLEAIIVERTQESATIFSLHLRFLDPEHHNQFLFYPGQFNMLYLYGVGEVAISIVSDPEKKETLTHTIRAIGRVTKALQKLQPGDRIGIRGPFGRGWPLEQTQGKDIIVLTGGLGCAPSVSIVHYILARRENYGHLSILQGVKHSDDFIFRKQYEIWQQSPNTIIHIAADQAGPKWPWATGYITDMINKINLTPHNTAVMMCGPEMMMNTAVKLLTQKGISEHDIYLSMERNMECGIGQCGHCQYGGFFICKDGPIFAYSEIKELFNETGF
ncbi:FAD/NAD(P)-binding protein [Legionella longbeachae]|uniref:Hydrogenase/sulfur reductase gamma subunit n=1 Tax=Legionella longbeachae serogroup 1 (strain NSW150) TaxID=661367 RepID=D3HKA5_LEGLN|nr:FAD/NAD(P)-binding protein [Legionella longbeachae]VEE03385.1 hydrogenase/sulfur reductase gamma subunit [Legionella oakridgensis]HBD7397661.1 FAD/NAD(P)-binding protein [Legionella pneumophila]ARB93721.1 Ni/Fe hydrogenase subunit gamma [Legionella longbeachae]ARM33139.1 Ni/Fe hydrogenase subunit gamma [Legionella longbeachae]EEZ94013.1 putative (NiFe) hydrogenase gamma subunit [Legionella longbeachae D-4968]